MNKIKFIALGALLVFVFYGVVSLIKSPKEIIGLKNVDGSEFNQLVGNWKGEGFGGSLMSNGKSMMIC